MGACPHHMSSGSIPSSSGEKSVSTLAARPTGGSAFCGALDDGTEEGLVFAGNHTETRRSRFLLLPLYHPSPLLFCYGAQLFLCFDPPMVLTPQNVTCDEWGVKSAHHSGGKKQTEKENTLQREINSNLQAQSIQDLSRQLWSELDEERLRR